MIQAQGCHLGERGWHLSPDARNHFSCEGLRNSERPHPARLPVIIEKRNMLSVIKIAKKINLSPDELYLFGPYKAKILPSVWEKIKGRADGHLILVTAMTPTPAGEGKTVTTIGIAQGLVRLGKKTVAALREPSLGPVFGLKGGAAGGGLAKVEPAEEIDLHFTGDFHALAAAQNLLAALLDNHLYFGNELQLDPARIVWHRALDVNDRALRNVTIAVGQKGQREESFLITAASELMAILCLSADSADLRNRLARIIVGYDVDGEPVTAVDLKAVGAMMKLLKQALWPNLVQTTEGVPAIIHGGPFGNIAHGCNSLLATTYALKLADYVVTEAGFGADLGAEKFFDIKCRVGGLKPALAVVVATVRALKYLGGVGGIGEGLGNLKKHVENVQKFGVPVVVAVNRFTEDSEAEIETVMNTCAGWGVPAAISDGFDCGGGGCTALAKLVVEQIAASARPARSFEGETRIVRGSQPSPKDGTSHESSTTGFHALYRLDIPIKQKIETVAREIYGADGVDYTAAAEEELGNLEKLGDLGVALFPICMAKTQYSFSDDPKKINVTRGFRITVRRVYPSAGAGFIVVLTGEIMTMPGLPRHPLAEAMVE